MGWGVNNVQENSTINEANAFAKILQRLGFEIELVAIAPDTGVYVPSKNFVADGIKPDEPAYLHYIVNGHFHQNVALLKAQLTAPSFGERLLNLRTLFYNAYHDKASEALSSALVSIPTIQDSLSNFLSVNQSAADSALAHAQEKK